MENLTLQGFHSPIVLNRDDGYGGVAIYIRSPIHFIPRHDLHVNGVEAIWAEIRLNSGKFLISSFYRKPNSPVAHWAAIEESFSLAKDDNKHCIILGDFNYDILRYPTDKIFDLANKLNLQQLILAQHV
ncbi:hypothetical protein SNE40_010179 [Patella caerulea]|uniref:Endonuclease/exonuclease/phosphatase domain-containing protein n=1 Tax=Patella caerulea TaxID=87958 RepID=A0AAN8Q4A8_PATCE